MILYVGVENMKAFSDTGLVRFAPLTILMGQNSSGKTTLLQSILVARQTVDSRDLVNPVVIDGSYTNLGSYPELVHDHQTRNLLGISLGFTVPEEARILAPHPRVWFISVHAKFSYDRRTSQIFTSHVEGVTGPEEFTIEKRRRSAKNSSVTATHSNGRSATATVPSTGKFYDIGTVSLSSRMRYSSVDHDDPEALLFGFGYSLPVLIANAFERSMRRVHYVGPLRTNPERVYVARGETPQDVGIRGESTFDILWTASRSDSLKRTIFEPTNSWLSRFGIGARLDIRRIGGSYFNLMIRDPITKVLANFADVGFGASQILSAVVQCLYSPPDSTIIMEQPELHLHPHAQAEFGDFAMEQVKAGRQLIIETHSEHMVSRIMRRVAEGKLDEDQVAVLFCTKDQGGSRIVRIGMNEYGQFGGGLPSGFLDQDYAESLAHMEAIARRRATSARE